MGMFTTIDHTHACATCGKDFEDGCQIKTAVPDEQWTLNHFKVGEVVYPGHVEEVGPGLIHGYRDKDCDPCHKQNVAKLLLPDRSNWNEVSGNLQAASVLLDKDCRVIAVVEGFLNCDRCR